MNISRETIEQVQQAVDVVEVVGDFVSLKKKGQYMMACCPFHHEKSPSFTVTPAKGIYHCFGCGKSGDSIQFVMDHESFTFGEAILYLAKKYNIDVKETGGFKEDEAQKSERESILIALNYAKNYYVKNLWENDEAKTIGLGYFRERGFSDPTIQNFELGYSFDTWDGLHASALKEQYTTEALLKAGLVLTKEGKEGEPNRYYDRFRGRVMFPIHNVAGKVVGFGARILTKDKNQPKYLNSPETEVYHKSKTLYGLFQSKTHIKKLDECYLVEGYTDVISLHQAGVENVVASSGTALTEDQIKLVKRYTNNITLLYDGDTAGIKAALRGVDLILEQDMNVSVVVLPDQEDPDSYAKKYGSEGLLAFVAQHKKDFITFKANLLSAEAGNDPFKRAEIIKDIVQSIVKVKDAIKRAVFFRECSRLLDIDEQVLISEHNKLVYSDRRQPQVPEAISEQDIESQRIEKIEQAADINADSVFRQEEMVVKILLNYFYEPIEEGVTTGYFILKELGDVTFQTPIFATIVQEIIHLFEQDQSVTSDHFIHHTNPDISKVAIRLFSNNYAVSENWEKFEIIIPTDKDIIDYISSRSVLRLKRVAVRHMIHELTMELKEEKNEEALMEKMKIIMELKKVSNIINERLGIVIG